MARQSTRPKQFSLRREVVQALRTISAVAMDHNVHDIGCAYALDVDNDGRVSSRFTLTERGYLREQNLAGEVCRLLRKIDSVGDAFERPSARGSGGVGLRSE